MEIVIQDKNRYLDFYVDGKHAARLEVFASFKYKIITSTGVLHELVLRGLFIATMKKRS